jgi:chitin disaccharide deacetylase
VNEATARGPGCLITWSVGLDDAGLVAAEVSWQLSAFRSLVGGDPSHIDSHQHVHLREPVRSVVVEMARQLNVPLRNWTPGIRYCGRFYGQSAEGSPLPHVISVEGLITILESLPPGLTELGCHPGEGADFDSPYWTERAHEVQALCDPRIRAAIGVMGIALCSFTDAPVRALGRAIPRLPSKWSLRGCLNRLAGRRRADLQTLT